MAHAGMEHRCLRLRSELEHELMKLSVPSDGVETLRTVRLIGGGGTHEASRAARVAVLDRDRAASADRPLEVQKKWRKAYQLGLYLPHAVQPGAPRCVEPLLQDRRFAHPIAAPEGLV